ncbi:MAG: cytochrome C biogenesis protein, partial [Bacteroidota bacterium]|nr:cytochrome C biogenesis protein [Bacteroidota bacterium]
MKMINDVLTFALPFFYLVTVIAYGFAFATQKQIAKKIKIPFLAVTISVHLLYLVTRTIYFLHPPIISVFEIFSLLAFSIAASYRIIEFRTGVKNTGVIILFLSLIFQTISSLFIQDIYEVKPILRSNLLGVHVLSAL